MKDILERLQAVIDALDAKDESQLALQLEEIYDDLVEKEQEIKQVTENLL